MEKIVVGTGSEPLEPRLGLLSMLAALSEGFELPRIRTSKRYTPNGERECARRVRQIQAGILTESNGLVRTVAEQKG